jgi:hypothetical protein
MSDPKSIPQGAQLLDALESGELRVAERNDSGQDCSRVRQFAKLTSQYGIFQRPSL